MRPFKSTDIIRYGSGEDSLMMVNNVILRHMSDGYDRYYGIGIFGNSVSVSSRHCQEATEEEKETYRARRCFSKDPV